MRLRLLYVREVVVEMTSSSTLEGLLLDRPSWDLLVANRDVIEHHAKIPVGDEHGEQVRVWIELKKKRKNVSYAKVKIFNRKVYIDLRDYWYPNGPEAGIAGTKRGVCLSLEGWLTLVEEMDTVEELWHDAREYLQLRSNVREVPITLDDVEDSQLVVLDD